MRCIRAVPVAGVVAFLACGGGQALAQALEKVKVGTSSVVTDGVLYIAAQKGFFKKQQLDVEIIPFDSSPKLIPPLGIGQIDVAAGAATASLYNAVARKINLRIVADKGSAPRHYDYMPLVVRKSLLDSGRFKGYADLAGLVVAEAGAGSSSGSTLNEALRKGGLAYKDVKHTYIPYTSQFAAFTNGAIDAAISTEPTVTQIVESGVAVRMPREEFYPDQQVALLLYSDEFIAKKPDAARRFMVAYVEAVRLYNDALQDGRFAGPAANEVIDILAANTVVRDRTLYPKMVPAGINPDGHVNEASLQKDYAFFKSQGLIPQDVDVKQMVDNQFVDFAVKTLGPYRRK
jgi:NitT/TauT family transport system substrate-binding protein